jgi:hypothetical protein
MHVVIIARRQRPITRPGQVEKVRAEAEPPTDETNPPPEEKQS